MAGEATHPDLINGSLVGILSELEQDKTFLRLAAGDIEASDDVDNSVLAGIPEGLRPALAAAIGQGVAGKPGKPVVLVVASGREAEETVGSLRSWYDGDPNDIAQLEAWETLPHERLSPRADTVASRMAVFRRLKHPSDTDSMFGPIRILVMPIRSLIQPVVQGLGDVEPLVFTVGEDLPLDEAAKRLIENAYTRVDLVMDRGEFAVRGGILDVFPPTAPHPVRIEFFGDEIDTIKEFHASDQRTYGDGLKTIWATACRELQLTDAVRTRAKALVGSIPNAEDMLESIANAIPVEGMESLMPALVDHLEPVGSMLPKHAVILLSDPEKLRRSAEDLAKTANEFLAASWHVAASGHGAGAPISFDEASFLDYAETISSLEYSEHPVIRLTSFGVDTTLTGHVQLDAQNPAEFRGDEAKASQGIEGLLDAGFHVTITAAAAGTLARLKRAINTTGIANFDVIRSQAIDGFVDKAAKIALLTERDLTGRTSAVAVAKTPKRRRKAIDLVELKKGDYVVHEQHGIGRFIEMRQRIIGTGANKTTREYLVIEYAPSKRGAPADKLFIPTDQLDQVSKYIGAEAPKLNKLGGSDWAATKAKARKHVHEIADDLIKLYSARQRAKGFAFSPDTPWQKELEDAFPYQETADQLTTIDEVKSDMEKPVPMDRLICGDVGFGKTEIALRAAFKAVQDGKQVAVLVPTTLLVQQHYETFSERFEGFPVNVAAMSRFQTTKEINEAIEGLETGTVDVVIGTHKLLNPKIKFKDLGLVIIDEEQRFGVEHKETLKALRTNVDVLSLSATPIPRTLEMAVTGIREMSTLATLAQNTALGSGFDVAMKDLEVRGTGNLLGDEQSGHIEGVGFDLYVRMVSEAVEKYKEPEENVEPVAVSIDLPIEASIPIEYIDSDKLRLEAYRKLASARNEADLKDLEEELTDRYGKPPVEFETLFDVARLKFKARKLGISEILAQSNRVRIGRIDPPESIQMRMGRIYKGTQYRPVTHQLIVPTPFTGSLGQGPMSSDQVVLWTNQLLDDLAWTPSSSKRQSRL